MKIGNQKTEKKDLLQRLLLKILLNYNFNTQERWRFLFATNVLQVCDSFLTD